MFGRRTYHEIARVGEKRVVPAHTELAAPLALAVIAEIGGSQPLAPERHSAEYCVDLHGPHKDFSWRGRGEKAHHQFQQLREGSSVDVAYQNNFFGLLAPDIVSVSPLSVSGTGYEYESSD